VALLVETGERVPRRTVYRIVRTDPPTLADFTSNATKGLPVRDDAPEARRLWDGLSVYATEAQARNKARQFPYLGRYVARLDIPQGTPIRIERTIPHSRGHHTLWGEPALLLRAVVAVVTV
jgi:hypothetical protein